jgi:hypothetical protein
MLNNASASKRNDGSVLYWKNGAKSGGFNIPGSLAMVRRAVINWRVRDLTPS